MGQFVRAAHSVHFVMQHIVAQKFTELSDGDRIKMEKSAFDDYDRENGYINEEEPENVWITLRDNVDRIIKISTRIFNTGYDECMRSDIVALLEHVNFEINTIDESKE